MEPISGPPPKDSLKPPTQYVTSILKLSDGRELAYIEFGARPVSNSTRQTTTFLYFHGFPGSRLEGVLASNEAQARNVRLISIDRPGMGLSTFQSNRKFLDWPKDITELVHHLGIETFYIVAASGGAPFALACIKSVPPTKLLGVGIISGCYPFRYGNQGMPMRSKFLMYTASSVWTRPLVTWGLDLVLGRASRDPKNVEKIEEGFMKDMAQQPEPDRRVLDDLTIRRRLVETTMESFRRDSHGVALEAGLYAGEWGFELAECRHENLHLWHGRLDANVPVAMAENAAKIMDWAEFKVFEDDAHLSCSARHFPGMFDVLLKKGSVNMKDFS